MMSLKDVENFEYVKLIKICQKVAMSKTMHFQQKFAISV